MVPPPPPEANPCTLRKCYFINLDVQPSTHPFLSSLFSLNSRASSPGSLLGKGSAADPSPGPPREADNSPPAPSAPTPWSHLPGTTSPLTLQRGVPSTGGQTRLESFLGTSVHGPRGSCSLIALKGAAGPVVMARDPEAHSSWGTG